MTLASGMVIFLSLPGPGWLRVSLGSAFLWVPGAGQISRFQHELCDLFLTLPLDKITFPILSLSDCWLSLTAFVLSGLAQTDAGVRW